MEHPKKTNDPRKPLHTRNRERWDYILKEIFRLQYKGLSNKDILEDILKNNGHINSADVSEVYNDIFDHSNN